MTTNADLENLKAAYKAWHDCKGTDTTCWLNIMADEIQFHSMFEEAPGLAFAKDRKSKHEMSDYFATLAKNWTMVHWTPESFVSEDDSIAMFGRCCWTNNETNKTADVRVGSLCKFKDGKIVEYTEIFDSAQAAEAAIP